MYRKLLRTRIRRKRYIKLNAFTLILLAGGAGYMVILAAVSLLSVVTSKVAPDTPVISVFTALALFIGAYVGGYISAKNRHKNGLLMGVCCGLFMFLVILIIGLIISGRSQGFSAPVKFFITVAAGGIGGVVGVNSSTFR